MSKVKCIKPFILEECDPDGFFTDDYIAIQKNTVFNVSSDGYRLVGDSDTVRLENGIKWLELTKETFNEHFVVIDNECI
jgi:hypothetical protein